MFIFFSKYLGKYNAYENAKISHLFLFLNNVFNKFDKLINFF